MEASQKGIDLIKHFEQFRADAYQDSAGVWTVGYGATGKGIKKGTHWDIETALADLAKRVHSLNSQVGDLVKVPLTQDQFDALISFAYNLGVGALGESTLLKRVNEGRHAEAADEFLRWIHAGGKKLKGLQIRRECERALFLGEDWGATWQRLSR